MTNPEITERLNDLKTQAVNLFAEIEQLQKETCEHVFQKVSMKFTDGKRQYEYCGRCDFSREKKDV